MKFAQLSWAALVTLAAAATPAAAAGNIEFRTQQMMPYLAFDKLDHTTIDVPGGQLVVGLPPGDFKIGKREILKWIERSGAAISVFYGHFPVKSARVLVVPDAGDKISGGQAFGNAGAAVRVLAGTNVTTTELNEDWQLAHEMTHLALPDLQKATWLSEGLAVYVEPIARAQAGDLTEQHIWSEFIKMLPMGLPKKGDKGLDASEERDRVYYGGATFWLMADLEIRKRTQNRLGLQDALRGIQAAGGNYEQVWSVDHTLAIGDEATGQTVLTEFYNKWRSSPVSPDLPGLWKALGIKKAGENVNFDDNAPLAEVRRAITMRRADSAKKDSGKETRSQ